MAHQTKNEFTYKRPFNEGIPVETFYTCLDFHIRCKTCVDSGTSRQCARWIAHENGEENPPFCASINT